MLFDTLGLLCLHNRAEPFHGQACTFYHAAHVRLTHSDVFAECVALSSTLCYFSWGMVCWAIPFGS